MAHGANFFDRSCYLYEEPANLLKQELREPAVYNAIIKAIAEGASRLNEIVTKNLPIDIREIGQWWGTDAKRRKEVQIDIVATPVEGDAFIIGSCKYRNEKVGLDEEPRRSRPTRRGDACRPSGSVC